MAVRIRLRRMGKKKDPFYRIVVTDSRVPQKGRFLEQVGHYDPRRSEIFKINEDRIQYWVHQGAKPSPAVLRLMKRAEIEKERMKEAEDEGTD